MKTQLILVAGVLAFGVSLHADTSYTFNFNSTSAAVTDPNNNEPINPYSGTIAGLPVTLFCDDFPDTIQWGQQGITAFRTAVTASATTLDNDTRYGDVNPGATAGNTYPKPVPSSTK